MTHIFIPNKNIIDCKDPMQARVGLEGWYTLRARRRSGRVTRELRFKADREVGPFHNLITNNGLDRFGSSSGWLGRCHVGTGTTPPEVTDTQLANFHASVANNSGSASNGNSGSPDFYSWRTTTWTSALGALGTVVLTEVGISRQNTNGDLVSRELIRDSNGDPTSFPITDEEQLEVAYEIRVYPPLTDAYFTVDVAGTSRDVVARPLNISTANSTSGTSMNGWGVGGAMAGVSVAQSDLNGTSSSVVYTGALGASDATNPQGSSLGSNSSHVNHDYSSSDHYRDSSSTWSINAGNGSGRTVRVQWWCARMQFEYDPVIEKVQGQIMRLDFRLLWGRR